MKSAKLWIILAIVGGVLLLGLFLFPPRSREQVGSTFGKTPDGYGAWYAYMKKQGYEMEQLQKSEDKFLAQKRSKATTLLRVYPDFTYIYIGQELEKWVRQGNRVVLIGIKTPATNAPFQGSFNTAQGVVTIETKRRRSLNDKTDSLLADEYGSVVWQTDLDKGKIIFVATPYLAANAYQESEGNFAYLAHLVNAKTNTIVVDEYLHGYVDREELVENSELRDWFAYLMKTPLVIMAWQLAVILLLLLWSQNRRFGNIIPFTSPKLNNNLEYIDALSEVLFKAESHGFVVSKITKAEQIYIQQKLGLGSVLLPLSVVAASWQQQGKGSNKEIWQGLQGQNAQGGIKPLFQWLICLAILRRKLS